jgi:hypothetical protein
MIMHKSYPLLLAGLALAAMAATARIPADDSASPVLSLLASADFARPSAQVPLDRELVTLAARQLTH